VSPFSLIISHTFVQNYTMTLIILGYAAALLIGLALGLIGGGGSILTVPVLVYLLGIPASLATGYSLFVVGATSLVGGIQKYRQGDVDVKTAVIFGIPSIIAVYLTRAFIVPAIPAEVFTLGNFTMTKDILLMALFAALMIAASFSMIRSKPAKATTNTNEAPQPQAFNYPLILAEGAVVGVITGMVGAGGGFLIIPALVFLAKLPMKIAIGTSLMIIAAKSLIGFMGDALNAPLDWQLLLIFTAISIVGIFVGNILSRRIPADSLKVGFGWFVLVMGIYILFKQFA
jgi:uncharacterized membrane protein YfcA